MERSLKMVVSSGGVRAARWMMLGDEIGRDSGQWQLAKEAAMSVLVVPVDASLVEKATT
jgi:hypothetical protein